MAQGDWQTGADCVLFFITCGEIHISQHSAPHTAVSAGRYEILCERGQQTIMQPSPCKRKATEEKTQRQSSKWQCQ